MTAIVPIDPALSALIKGSFGMDGLPLPFVREIFLMECHVAGTSHVDLADIEPNLASGQSMHLQRDPTNAFDPLAIRIHDEAGRLLGFVPRDRNEVIARLMDAGKLIFGRLETKQWNGTWLKIEVRVFLRDM